ncbi:hypothetical protein CI109_106290 [Kwoniella shandongensis]|uniref:Uncharacterized protein n=1 Tax=Kwoniella shandongensis TaxID=1734106 RepID=A0A5M6BTL8_9TREE|nr:uncharacterized protein CI109_006735 [Kwoniella shandongensis]KAA5524935.1 hypothetical protein CI109_006735 [Kwoniella shandongensis]
MSLSKKQLTVLLTARIVEPIGYTILLPFVNNIMEDLLPNVPKEDIGKYSGAIESVWALCSIMFVYRWGKLSDRIGRKPVILGGLAGLTFSLLMFGLSKSFWWAMGARALSGVLCGNSSVLRATLAEITDQEAEGWVYPLWSIFWDLSCVLAPAVGALLANPVKQYPKSWIGHVNFFRKFPYFLPCTFAAGFAFLSAFLVFLFLEETLPAKRNANNTSPTTPDERSSLLSEQNDESSTSNNSTSHTFWDLISIKAVQQTLITQFLITVASNSFDAVIVLFFYPSPSLGGIGLAPPGIALIFFIKGAVSIVLSLSLFPFAKRKFGVRTLFPIFAGCWVVSYSIPPIMNALVVGSQGGHWIKDGSLRGLWFLMVPLLFFYVVSAFCFPLNMIAINEAAPDPATLGAVNAIGLIMGALGRSIGPATVGSVSSSIQDRYEILARRLEQVEAAYVQLASSTTISSLSNSLTAETLPFLPFNSTSSSRSELFSNTILPSAHPPLPRERSSNASTYDRVITLRSRAPDMDGFKKHQTRHPATVQFGEQSMCTLDLEGFPDVVKRGKFTSTQVDMYFQLFKHRFSLIAPLIPFLLTSSPLPKHPFVIVAALAFIPNVIPPDDIGIIDESMMYAMSGTTSVDVILALYILSFAPFQASSEWHIPITPLRLVSLAWTMGKDLGLELKWRRELGNSQRVEELLLPWNMPQLEELTLWEAVKSRYCILQIQYARCNDLPPLLATHLPHHPSDYVRQCINHLQREAEMVEICRDLAEEIAIVEADTMRQWPNMTPLVVKWEAMENEMRSLRMKSKGDQTYTLPSALALRLMLFSLCPPGPINPDISLQSHSLGAGVWIRSAQSVLYEFLSILYLASNGEDPPSALPSCVTLVMAVCISIMRRVLVVTQRAPYTIFDEQQLEKAERYLGSLEGYPRRAMKEMWGYLYEYKDAGEGESEPGIGEFEFDFFDWDMLFPASNVGETLPQ